MCVSIAFADVVEGTAAVAVAGMLPGKLVSNQQIEANDFNA